MDRHLTIGPAAGEVEGRSRSGKRPFSYAPRAGALAAMSAEPVDLLVLGGGVTGAGIARDAALRGIRTALVEMGDSGATPRLAFVAPRPRGPAVSRAGGLPLVFESTHERRVLLRSRRIWSGRSPFVSRVSRRARPGMEAGGGLWLYDALAAFRNVHMHRWLSRQAVLALEPRLATKGLQGAALYYDAQVDDVRSALATMRSAAQAGALVANYAEVTQPPQVGRPRPRGHGP